MTDPFTQKGAVPFADVTPFPQSSSEKGANPVGDAIPFGQRIPEKNRPRVNSASMINASEPSSMTVGVKVIRP